MQTASLHSGARRGSARLLTLAAVARVASGCGKSGPERIPVFPTEGKVIWKGQPAPGALVVLHPKGTLDARAFPHSYYGSGGTLETYSFHNGGANIAFGDGRVQFMAEAIGIRDFARLVTRDGSEVTSGEVQ